MVEEVGGNLDLEALEAIAAADLERWIESEGEPRRTG